MATSNPAANGRLHTTQWLMIIALLVTVTVAGIGWSRAGQASRNATAIEKCIDKTNEHDVALAEIRGELKSINATLVKIEGKIDRIGDR